MKEDWIYKRGDLYYANLNPLFWIRARRHLSCPGSSNNVGNFSCPTYRSSAHQ